jgi:hypothetical protein
MQRKVARWYIFKTKNHNLGKSWRATGCKMLVYCGIFEILYGHFVYVTAIWYILW